MRRKNFVVCLAVLFFLSAAGGVDAATFTVTTGADSGPGSLRQAVLSANANGETNIIDVAASVKEINIASAINVESDVTVNGLGATVRGSKISRLFGVSRGTAKFNRLTFTDGYALSDSGGAVNVDSSAGKAEFVNCTFFYNRAGKNGGAVHVYGGGNFETTFTHCTLVGNGAGDNGGGVGISGGFVRFTASVVTGNTATYNADIHTEGGGNVANSGQYNVVGQTNASALFPSALYNNVSVAASDVFKTPGALTLVDGVQVAVLLSATSNAALDKIPAANALNLPDIDQRGASRPQMTAVDAGAYELSPVALSSIELRGGTYVQKGTSENYSGSVVLYPLDATLDVRNYVNGIEWTAVNPIASEVISVDRGGNVTGLAAGEATLRATAHGWNSAGTAITATKSMTVKVGNDPLPAPTISVFFANERTEMAVGDKHALRLNLKVLPEGTPYKVLFESSDSLTATATQQNTDDTSAVIEALNVGRTEIKVTVTAENSRGSVTDSSLKYLLTVTERSGSGGGGGCNGGFGVLVFALGVLELLRRRRR